MKRYLLFGWYDKVFNYDLVNDNSNGGWKDFILDFDDEEEISIGVEEAIRYATIESFDHYHIVDTKTGEIIIDIK